MAIVFAAHSGVSSLIPGGFGVTIFFFLSGYLITTLFYREFDASGRVDLGAFYLRRLLRLSPPLAATLILTYALVAAGLFEGQLSPQAMTSQFLYFYNYYAALDPGATEGALGLNVLWSLSVEEHFYLIYPFVFILVALGRFRSGHVMALLAAILLWRGVRYGILGFDAADIYLFTDTRIDSILYGCLLAIWSAEGRARRIFPEGALPATLVSLAALSILLFCLVYRDDAFRATLRYSLQGVALMPLFHYAVTQPRNWIFRPLNWPVARAIGFYSYTIYLAHTVVIGNLAASGIAADNRYLSALLAFAACLLYAGAVSRYVERPIRSWRTRSRRLGFVEEASTHLPADGDPGSGAATAARFIETRPPVSG